MERRFLKRLVLGVVLVFLVPGLGQAQSSDKGDASTPGAQGAAGASGKAHDASFIIGNDDVLAISVWKEPDLTKSIPVRSDGKISLPLVGEVQAAGKTPLQLENDISEKLKGYITAPEVNVIVQQVNSRKFNILGEVGRPGSYSLTASMTIVDAIADAGGFKDFAKKSGIYVLRKGADGQQVKLNFNYKEFIKGKNTDKNIKIEPNDTIIVP
jgi:polysaccharide biosynthesis/export protein